MAQTPMNVSNLLKGEIPDTILAQNDVIFVPGSTAKTISHGVMNSIGSVLAAFFYIGVR
jgi:hypothetical protein